MDEGLSEGHRRVIGSGMLIVDAALVRMLNLLENRTAAAAMNVIEGGVSGQDRNYIRTRLQELQALIVRFVHKYDLQPSRRNLRRMLAADASQIWVTLEDCRPSRMRGYGAMSASSAESLETDVQNMLLIANELRRLLGS
jgi:hypothetical protein